MGEHDLAADPDCSEDDFGDAMCSPSPQEMEVENVVFHPNYSNPKPFQNDIAVIKLASEVVENDYVSLVCLPYIDDDENYATNRFSTNSERFYRDLLTSDNFLTKVWRRVFREHSCWLGRHYRHWPQACDGVAVPSCQHHGL